MKYILTGMPDKMMYTEYISVVGFIWYHIGVFIFLMMFQYLFSSTLQKAADQALHHTLKSMLFGLVFLIAVPLVSVLLLVTILGIPVGLTLLFAYGIVVLLVNFITSVSVANWVNSFLKLKWGFWGLYALSLAFFLAIMLLFRIPIVGWIVLGVLSCLAFGSLLVNIKWSRISKGLYGV